MGIIEDLKRDEGLRLKPYRCTAGKLTIGYGRNIDDVGISEEEAEYLLQNDVEKCFYDLCDIFGFYLFEEITIMDGHKDKWDALLNMRFNLGPNGFRKFKKMIAAVKRKDWKEVAKEAKKSKWYDQVGDRAKRIVSILEK